MLAPLGKIPDCRVQIQECRGDANMICVGPLASTVGRDIATWFEGNGYTPKAFQDTNSYAFCNFLKSLADDAYLEMLSTAMVAESGGDDHDVELDLRHGNGSRERRSRRNPKSRSARRNPRCPERV